MNLVIMRIRIFSYFIALNMKQKLFYCFEKVIVKIFSTNFKDEQKSIFFF